MGQIEAASNIADLKALAKRRVPRLFFDYVESGSWSGQTWRDNEADLATLKLRPRVCAEVGERRLATSILAQTAAMPVVLAPVGSAGLQCADGEIKAAAAAAKAGVPYTLSMMSICSIEDVAAAAAAPFWFQLYMMRDREFVARVIERAVAANCPALVLTVDAAVPGRRHVDARNGLTTPVRITARAVAQMAMRPGWCLGMLGTKRRSFGNLLGHVAGVHDLDTLGRWIAAQLDPTLSWRDVAWVRERFAGKLIIKGIIDRDDAARAVAVGADAIVVSNHGGRQLDGGPSSIRALPAVADAVGGKAQILFDGGVRSGHDVLRAVASGADAVMLGRAYVYGLGAGGEAGVSRALAIIRDELDAAMALCGERDLAAIGPHNLYLEG